MACDVEPWTEEQKFGCAFRGISKVAAKIVRHLGRQRRAPASRGAYCQPLITAGSQLLELIRRRRRAPARAMATSIIAMFKPPNRPKADAIISAVKANPALAKEVDAASGNTPLHFACCNCAPDEVVHALLAAYPKAAKAADGAGNLPIVGAVASGCGIAAVQALLKAHPEGIRARAGDRARCCTRRRAMGRRST